MDRKRASEIAEICLEEARKAGATYADARVTGTQTQQVSVADAGSGSVSESSDSGFGVRVVAGGAWGFAASSRAEPDEAKRTARYSVEIAKASAILKPVRPLKLAPVEPAVDEYETPVRIDPFAVSIDKKIDYLAGLTKTMMAVEGVSSASGSIDLLRQEKLFASSIGSRIWQVITHTGAGVSATARGEGRNIATRSFPTSQGGQFETAGYEMIERIGFEQNVERIAQEAVALLQAKECPSEEMDLVLDGPEMSLLIHESVGHALELDRVFGEEANFSGTSFATPDKLDKLRYASKNVTFTADATSPFGLGTFGYDDDGTKAHRAILIEEGILRNYLSSRETAARIGKASTGAMRAESWAFVPIVRMTNTNLLPGDKSLEEIISEVKNGIFMSGTTSWSIDDRREGFQFGCEVAWLIKDGKLGEMVRAPTYSGETVSHWNSCDAIANRDSWRVWGTPNCGKGQPAQNGRVGQGASPARFRSVRVG
jgi:TldD protein